MKLFAVFILLLYPALCPSQPAPQGTRGFPVVDRLGGWTIPPHAAPFAREARPYGKNHQLVNVIRYKSSRDFPISFYYQNAAGVLVVNSFYFYADEVDALEFNGARFAYFAVARGKQVSFVIAVRWLDVEGDGVYTRIVWGSDEPDIPEWALNGKKH